jgi:hypothetical protein
MRMISTLSKTLRHRFILFDYPIDTHVYIEVRAIGYFDINKSNM